jgi:hypothetical protein
MMWILILPSDIECLLIVAHHFDATTYICLVIISFSDTWLGSARHGLRTHSIRCFYRSLAAASFLFFLFLFILCQGLPGCSETQCVISRGSTPKHISTWVKICEAIHIKRTTLVHPFLRGFGSLISRMIDYALGEDPKYFIDTCTGLGARPEMLTTDTHSISTLIVWE